MNAIDRPWVEICGLDDIPRRGCRVVQALHGQIAVFRTADDEVFALDNRCPHKGGPLSEGIVHDRHVTCPLHNWVIGLADGQAVGADEGCVRRYPVRLAAARVFLSVSVIGSEEGKT
jgi:nitrite reductase (NADH) small subunit